MEKFKDIKDFNNISIFNVSYHHRKPKNWSRNNLICKCKLFIEPDYSNPYTGSLEIDFEISYKITNIKPELINNKKYITKKKFTNKKITSIKLPFIFNNINETDYYINIKYFERGRELIPYPIIYIKNNKKFENVLKKFIRKEKINKICSE